MLAILVVRGLNVSLSNLGFTNLTNNNKPVSPITFTNYWDYCGTSNLRKGYLLYGQKSINLFLLSLVLYHQRSKETFYRQRVH
jgi:hypothetical protein